MKTFLLSAFFLFIFSNCLIAQDTALFKAGWGNLDFSVPESPAFKLLGSNPSNILKPSSVRSIALSVGNYFYSNGPVIPKSLAVEISPLLLNGKCSLNDYNNNKFLYRLRFSVGTNAGSNGQYSIAQGVRLNIIDKTDLRTNTAFLKDIYENLQNAVTVEEKAIPVYIKKYKLKVMPVKFIDSINMDSALNKKFRAFEAQLLPESLADPNQLEKLRNKYRESLWNAQIWDVGLASLQTSKDSLIKNLKLSQVGLWTTLGIPAGKKGQVLFGAKLSIADSTKWQRIASLGIRYYYGKNDVKGFIETQFDDKYGVQSGKTSIGCEFNISNGIWGEIELNLVMQNGKISYQPGFNVGLGTGEKKKS